MQATWKPKESEKRHLFVKRLKPFTCRSQGTSMSTSNAYLLTLLYSHVFYIKKKSYSINCSFFSHKVRDFMYIRAKYEVIRTNALLAWGIVEVFFYLRSLHFYHCKPCETRRWLTSNCSHTLLSVCPSCRIPRCFLSLRYNNV